MKSKSLVLSTAIGCAAMLFAAACSEQKSEEQSRSPMAEPKLPSIVDDKPSLANVGTAPALHLLPQIDVDTTSAQEPAAAAPVQSPMPEDYAGLLKFAKGLGVDDHGRALEALKRARALNSKSTAPDVESARVLLAAGNAKAARPFAEAALDLDPSSSYAWNTMGRVELGELELEAALASFERAAEENEDNSYAWNNLGLTLMRLERFPEAATALERATSAGRPSAFMFNNLGMTYEHLARFDLAAAAYRQADDLGSAKAVANLNRLEDDGVDLSGPVADVDEPALEEQL